MHDVATVADCRLKIPGNTMSDQRSIDDLYTAPAWAQPHPGTSSAAPVRCCRDRGASAAGACCPACGQETRLALPTVCDLMCDTAGRLAVALITLSITTN